MKNQAHWAALPLGGGAPTGGGSMAPGTVRIDNPRYDPRGEANFAFPAFAIFARLGSVFRLVSPVFKWMLKGAKGLADSRLGSALGLGGLLWIASSTGGAAFENALVGVATVIGLGLAAMFLGRRWVAQMLASKRHAKTVENVVLVAALGLAVGFVWR